MARSWRLRVGNAVLPDITCLSAGEWLAPPARYGASAVDWTTGRLGAPAGTTEWLSTATEVSAPSSSFLASMATFSPVLLRREYTRAAPAARPPAKPPKKPNGLVDPSVPSCAGSTMTLGTTAYGTSAICGISD